MIAISVWQPHATAVALHLKKIETRGWSTRHRGLIAIHAAARWTKQQKDFAATERALGRLPDKLPLGAIVAIAEVVDVKTTIELVTQISAIERLYGNYEPGRFGWMLEHIRPLPEPIPYKGSQGFFHVPDELIYSKMKFQQYTNTGPRT